MPKFKVEDEETKAKLRRIGIPHIVEEKGETGSGIDTYWEARWSCGCATINDFGKRSIKPCSPKCMVLETTKNACESNGIYLEIRW